MTDPNSLPVLTEKDATFSVVDPRIEYRLCTLGMFYNTYKVIRMTGNLRLYVDTEVDMLNTVWRVIFAPLFWAGHLVNRFEFNRFNRDCMKYYACIDYDNGSDIKKLFSDNNIKYKCGSYRLYREISIRKTTLWLPTDADAVQAKLIFGKQYNIKLASTCQNPSRDPPNIRRPSRLYAHLTLLK